MLLCVKIRNTVAEMTLNFEYECERNIFLNLKLSFGRIFRFAPVGLRLFPKIKWERCSVATKKNWNFVFFFYKYHYITCDDDQHWNTGKPILLDYDIKKYFHAISIRREMGRCAHTQLQLSEWVAVRVHVNVYNRFHTLRIVEQLQILLIKWEHYKYLDALRMKRQHLKIGFMPFFLTIANNFIDLCIF